MSQVELAQRNPTFNDRAEIQLSGYAPWANPTYTTLVNPIDKTQNFYHHPLEKYHSRPNSFIKIHPDFTD